MSALSSGIHHIRARGAPSFALLALATACNVYRPSLFDADADPRRSCTDGALNGDESDIDCGGSCPTKCDDATGCVEGTDCANGVCRSGSCQPAACDDDVLNGDESDVDCGGSCDGCEPEARCNRARDCASAVCRGGECVAASCDDGVVNGGESDVDCGGDGSCERCPRDAACTSAADCAAGLACDALVCVTTACNNGRLDAGESDIDCGGGCDPCAAGQLCSDPADCVSTTRCDGTRCRPLTCSNGADDGDETDVDCGGACGPCGVGEGCLTGADCATRECRGDTKICAGPKALYQNLSTTPATSIRANFQIVHDGSAALPRSRLELRYYYKTDGSESPLFQCYFGCEGTMGGFVRLPVEDATATADAYFRLRFTDGTIPAGGQVDRIEVELRRDGTGLPYTVTNDYSYLASARTALVPNSKVVLLLDDVVVWGEPPPTP